MTAPAEASTGAAPWPVERRPRLRAVAVSGACCVLGLLVFLVTAGMALDGSDAGPRRPAAWLLLLAADAVVGVTASALAGFLRGSRAASVALVVAAACSAWALPAGVVGVVRLGARRSTALDVLVVAVLVGGGLGSARVSRLVAPPERDPLPWWGEALALAVSAVVLLLWGRVRGTRVALVESLRRQAGAAEGERAALARSREADVARTRAEERTAIARDMHDTLSHQALAHRRARGGARLARRPAAAAGARGGPHRPRRRGGREHRAAGGAARAAQHRPRTAPGAPRRRAAAADARGARRPRGRRGFAGAGGHGHLGRPEPRRPEPAVAGHRRLAGADHRRACSSTPAGTRPAHPSRWCSRTSAATWCSEPSTRCARPPPRRPARGSAWWAWSSGRGCSAGTRCTASPATAASWWR
nr:hypothetical protein [Angustibacter aerolatus]